MCSINPEFHQQKKRIVIDISPLPFSDITNFVFDVWEGAYLVPEGMRVKLIHRVIQSSIRVSRSILKKQETGRILIEAQTNPLIATISIRDYSRSHEIIVPEIDCLSEYLEYIDLTPTPYIICIASLAPPSLRPSRDQQ